MDRPVFVVSADRAQANEVCQFLEGDNYRTVALHSLEDLGVGIRERAGRIIILDLDTLPVDNRFIAALRRENPGLRIIGLSNVPFHPELKEAMSSHISACIGKPPDQNELTYCLKSFCNNGLSDEELQEKEKTQDVEP